MRIIYFLSILMTLLVCSPYISADSIKLGIFPYISASRLLKTHLPVAKYLSENLNQPVDIISAPSFPEFIARTKQQKFDIIITAPHMGTLAILQSNYQRLAVTNNRTYAVFVTLKASGIKTLKDVNHASLTLPPQKAIISQLALQTLSEQGTDFNSVDITFTLSHNNALQSVLNRESDVAAFAIHIWESAEDSNKEILHVLGASTKIPGLFILARPGMPAHRVDKISSLLQNYHRTQAGKNYFKHTKFNRFRAITETDINELKPHVQTIFNFKD